MLSPRVLAAALGLTVSMLAAPAAQGAVVTGGDVQWGVKESFRNYLKMAFTAGDMQPSDGATQSPPPGAIGTSDGGGPFRFPITGGDAPSTSRVSVGTRGKVHFTGHAGALDFAIYNVRVVFDGTASGPCLIADADSKRFGGTGAVQSYRNVRFAKLNAAGISPTGGGRTWTNVPATLTPEGAPAFAGFYEPGTELDPVTFTYSAAPGSGTEAGACEKRGTVVTVPPGSKPPASTPAGATLKLGKPNRGQLSLLARGRYVRTKVRVSQAGKVTLTARGRIARKTRNAAKVSKRATGPGVVTMRWRLGKGARRELARKRKLKVKLEAALPGAAKPATQRFTLKAPKVKKARKR
ncbi:MAG TPA: HtaA domain-containing protein [Thermoleophilaceae bacterium]|nr:HtaA domain-containing protein [Thermoleophilaceae bacterium]